MHGKNIPSVAPVHLATFLPSKPCTCSHMQWSKRYVEQLTKIRSHLSAVAPAASASKIASSSRFFSFLFSERYKQGSEVDYGATASILNAILSDFRAA